MKREKIEYQGPEPRFIEPKGFIEVLRILEKQLDIILAMNTSTLFIEHGTRIFENKETE